MSAIVHPALRPVRRWVASRKELVAQAVKTGAVTMQQALDAHDLSPEELAGWIAELRHNGRGGLAGLRPRSHRTRPLPWLQPVPWPAPISLPSA